jgi:hypothetical protein
VLHTVDCDIYPCSAYQSAGADGTRGPVHGEPQQMGRVVSRHSGGV